jgi:hypothetical protein
MVIEERQDIIAFSAFLGNELDPLWLFNDAAFHRECFNNHPLAKVAETRWQEIRERMGPGPGNRGCVVCKERVTDPDDYFAIGHLIADPSHPLYRFNYTLAHISHLKQWEDLPLLCELLTKLKESPGWRGKSLDYLLADLQKALSS